jgi:hypothetical protein
MHRVDTPGATLDNKFTDGSPSSGVPSTVVDADILNALQEEIVYCIEQMGIVLEKGVNTQLWAALLLKFATIAALNTHAALPNPHRATSAATADRLILRDASGRAKIAAPAASDDIARLGDMDVRLVNFTGTNQSKATTGYQKLPGGLIVQWGVGQVSSTTVEITFPIAFPTACFGVTNTPQISQTAERAPGAYNITPTGAILQVGGLSNGTLFYVAIGY